MAVYRRRYQAQEGALTSPRWRFLIFTRYATRGIFASRVLSLYFFASLLAPLVGATIIYLHFNPLGLRFLNTSIRELIPIDGAFFLRFLIIQTSLGSLLAAIIGPGLIAPDLANNALPLYLARPVTRGTYILGKLMVLVGMMSVLTWIPIMLLYALQCGLAGWSWFAANLRIAFGIMACSVLWIAVVSLLTLAVSAWVRWRTIATLSVFVYFMISAAIGSLINEILNTEWGSLFNIGKLMRFLWTDFFGIPPTPEALGTTASMVAVSLTCLVFLAMLRRRIRAFEVVR
jgi:ABC-2 type transport system permease protein